ncbi:MAG: hypothetical protein ABSF23_05705 [Terracidiphilus sp.]|jgi:hypothetical protein
MRCASLVAAFLLAAAVASAESASSQGQPAGDGYSSSQAGLSALGLPASEFPSAAGSSASGSGAGQYGNGGGYGSGKRGLFRNMAFELGGGFNAPESNAVTYGGQFTAGAGWNLSRHLAGLIEYQFLDAKLPGYLIAEAGAQGGHAHIWSLTLDPVIDLMPKATNDLYITGGGGFYRKVTSFTDPSESIYCDYYFGCYGVTTNVVVGHFSSNQGGYNVGAGFQHRLGGRYSEGKAKLFVEARYLFVDTPAVTTQPNGLGTTTVAAGTKIIPVAFGVRW